MNDLFWLFIHILATFRISYMFTEEQGPFDMFARLRKFTLAGDLDKVFPFNCFYCTSVWVGLTISFVSGSWLLYGTALSAGAMIIYVLFNKLEE